MFTTLQTTDLVQQIAREIGNAIAEGRLKPGEHLTELRLSREFGTSRAPVREAARLLESQGLVISSPRRGFFVRTLTSEELDDIYELRLGLEIHAADLALQRIGDAELDMLKAQVDKLYELADRACNLEQIFEDFKFHRMLCGFSENARLLKIYDDIAVEMRLGITLIGELYDDPHRIAESHEPIMTALKRKDRAELNEALRYHIGVAQTRVVQLFKDMGV